LPRIEASRRKLRVPVCCGVHKRGDEGFGEGGFVASDCGYGSFVAHGKFARIDVFMIFR
jgi:hypothetical protein